MGTGLDVAVRGRLVPDARLAVIRLTNAGRRPAIVHGVRVEVDPPVILGSAIDHTEPANLIPDEALAGPVRLHGTGAVELTGAEPIRPPIPGLDLERVHLLHTMEDSFRVQARASELRGGSALVIGGGYIGLEMADALTHRGLHVIVVEQLPAVMPTVDIELRKRIGDELEGHGVQVMTATAVEGIERSGGRLLVTGSGEFRCEVDLVLVAVGVRPAVELAYAAGIETGVRRAIRVNRRMETNVSDVYAAGDCVET